MSKNYMYFTSDIDTIKDIAKQYSSNNNTEYIELDYNNDNIDKIISIFNNPQYNFAKITILLIGINKSNISDKLLKTLEENNNNNITLISICFSFDIKDNILSRFNVKYYNNIKNIEYCKKFCNKISLDTNSINNLGFYISLSQYIVDEYIKWCKDNNIYSNTNNIDNKLTNNKITNNKEIDNNKRTNNTDNINNKDYIRKSNNLLHNLFLINDIIHTIRTSTYNILYPALYDRLEEFYNYEI